MGWQPFGKGLYAIVDVGTNPFLKAAETTVAADTILGHSEVVCDVGIAEWVALRVSRGMSVPLSII